MDDEWGKCHELDPKDKINNFVRSDVRQFTAHLLFLSPIINLSSCVFFADVDNAGPKAAFVLQSNKWEGEDEEEDVKVSGFRQLRASLKTCVLLSSCEFVCLS